MSFEVDEVDGGDEADSLALPHVEVVHVGHAVEHLVPDHLRPHRHGLPPNLKGYGILKFLNLGSFLFV